MTVLATLTSIGMACGPPLIYADQARTIWQKRLLTRYFRGLFPIIQSSKELNEGRSCHGIDVCGIIMIANITRCFFYIGHPFELTLLFQSILLIISQLALLSLCLHFKNPSSTETPHGLRSFWRWSSLGSYLEFLAGLIVVLLVLQLVVGRWAWYYESLGYLALGLESTLPIPQFISNWKRKSCAGLSDLTVLFWLLGDLFKTGYFFARGNPWQFKITAIITVIWDVGIVCQRLLYGKGPDQLAVEEESDRPMVTSQREEEV